MKRQLFRNTVIPAAALFAASGLLGAAQTVDTNPAHKPDVFLSNEKKTKKDKAATSRTVTGQVTDETGQPLEGALVTITDHKSKEKTSFFTKKDGRYRFDDIAFNVDYDIQARYKDHSSDPRQVSQYDHMAQVVRILEIQTDAPAPQPAAAAAGKQH